MKRLLLQFVLKGGKLPSIRAAAKAAVVKAKWKPAKLGGLPADCWLSVAVKFNRKKN